MKYHSHLSLRVCGQAWLLAVMLGVALYGEAAPDPVPGAATLSLPGTGAPQPAVWKFGPMVGNVQSFSVTVTGFGAVTLPEGLVLTIPGQAAPRFPGMPDFPLVSVLIRGQAGKTVRVEVNPPRWIVIPGIRVAPAQSPALDETTGEASETRLVRTPAATVYGADEFWPADLVRAEEAWIGAGKRVRLECALMQYNPAGQILRYTLALEGRLVFETSENPGKP